jgi:glycerol kinase
MRSNWGVDRRWSPEMDTAGRDALYRDWKRAVERTFNWIEG